MSPTLSLELKKYCLGSNKSDSELVFDNENGNSLDPDNIRNRHFYPSLRRAKIRKVRIHDLRQTNIAMRIEQGQNIVYISRQAGHTSVKITLDIYGHLISDVNLERAK